MSQYETTSLYIAFIAALGGVIAVFFVGAQVRQGARNTKDATESRQREWDLRRREMSMNFYSLTLNSRESMKTRLPPDRDAKAIQAFIGAAETDTSKLDTIRTHLSLYEMMATGVNTGVYDVEIVNRFAGGPIVSAWINYEPWILARRVEFDAPTMFKELETVAHTIASIRHSDIDTLRAKRVASLNTPVN